MTLLHSAKLLLLDALDVALRRRPPLTPPRRAVDYIGGFDFHEVGRHLASIAVDVGGLTPESSIVDVGCGYGRLAVALLPFLDRGSYLGFDIHRPAIRWCARHVRRPNFRFVHADVRNRHYNRRGLLDAASFAFPAADADVVFASSVFTHLEAAAARHYLAETARVLKAGGRAVTSWFLLNDESRAAMQAGRCEPRMTFRDDGTAVQHVDDPEAAIAYDERFVRDAFAEAGLRIDAIHYGGWCSRAEPLSFQDFVIATKTSAAASSSSAT